MTSTKELHRALDLPIYPRTLILLRGLDRAKRGLTFSAPAAQTAARERASTTAALQLSHALQSNDTMASAAILSENIVPLLAGDTSTAIGGRGFLFYASAYNNMAVVRVLLQGGLDVNKADIQGQTALCIAAEMGSVQAVVVLLGHGADPNLSMVSCPPD
jgi:hypothetical protein